MNCLVERQWQTINQIARTCLVHARLPIKFWHFAVLYAVAILNVLPARSLQLPNGTPTCPTTLAFGTKPKIGNFRVFGCPAAVKHYTATTHASYDKSSTIEAIVPTPKPLQRAIRGIFIVFPEQQAGWLFYLPTPLGTHCFIVSRDVMFDEAFDSTLAHTFRPFSGAMPERTTQPLPDPVNISDSPLESTGSVSDYPFRYVQEGVTTEPDEAAAPETFEIDTDPPTLQPFSADDTNFEPPGSATDYATSESDDPGTNDDDQSTAAPEAISSSTTAHLPAHQSSPRRSKRPTKGNLPSRFRNQVAYFVAMVCQQQQHPLRTTIAEALKGMDPTKLPIDLFKPEPSSFQAILRLLKQVLTLWFKSIENDFTTLINNDSFDLIEQLISKRFNVTLLGQAQWFLPMLVHHHRDGSISIDQERFTLNLLQRFCNNDAPYGIPPFGDTPATPEYVYSVANRPTTPEAQAAIKNKYFDLDFRSCLCTILYLA
jgi:hypothetical protein